MNKISLELKIPPVALTFIFALVMWACTKLTPEIIISQPIKFILVSIFFLMGSGISILGVIEFKQLRTTVNPTTPEKSSSLVTSSVYSYTRNPMYVGFLCFLLAWGLFLSNPFALLLCIFFILYMNQFQIKPEEQSLENIFGQEYINYKQNVRRWL